MLFMLLLSIVLMGYSLCDYKRAVYLTSSYFVLQTHLSSGIPGVKLFYLISLFQLLIFLTKKRGYFLKMKYPMLLLVPCIIATVGYFFSSYYGVSKLYAQIVVSSICTFLYPIILFKIIKTRKDLNSFLSILFIVFLVVGIFTIIEAITHRNLYSDFLYYYNVGEGYYGGYWEKQRFGFRRCNSLFAFCSTLGMVSTFTFFIVFYLRVKKIVIKRKIENFLLLLMPVCVILTGTRSQYVVFFICLIPFIFMKGTYKTKIFKVMVVFAIALMVVFSGFIDQVLDSIFNSNENSGSSAEMRQQQLEICLYYLNQSPIWGLGKGYITKYIMPYTPELYGAESIWFRQMVDYGIVGCITYLGMCLSCLVWLYKYDKIFCFIPLAFLAGKTISIVVGIEVSYLLVTCIILQKIYALYIPKFEIT